MRIEEEQSSITTRFVQEFSRNPNEEILYRRPFTDKIWDLDTFAALGAGLSPDKFKLMLSSNLDGYGLSERKKFKSAMWIKELILNDLIDARDKMKDGFALDKHSEKLLDWLNQNGEIFWMSAWKFIAWSGMKGLVLTKRFQNELPFDLFEMYDEFWDPSRATKTNPRAHFIKALQNYIEREKIGNDVTNEMLCDCPFVVKLLDRITKSSGKRPKKSTVIQSWIKIARPKLVGRSQIRSKLTCI